MLPRIMPVPSGGSVGDSQLSSSHECSLSGPGLTFFNQLHRAAAHFALARHPCLRVLIRCLVPRLGVPTRSGQSGRTTPPQVAPVGARPIPWRLLHGVAQAGRQAYISSAHKGRMAVSFQEAGNMHFRSKQSRESAQGARLPQLPPPRFCRRPGHGPSPLPAVPSLRPPAYDSRAANRPAALADTPPADQSRT